ncbi:cyclin-A3-4-like isoform X3 [Rhododendron vialii]|uniref:cyclin-A3-4-like isoform X3 n=1 Tax=Rhododendron vialii TaxID=182163 RepID=UPI00265F9270|nr:cyclin-A3-4-like isoform X3 [Rhododendron vialii]
MADKENSVRVTRSGRKRAAPEPPHPATMKRVALGEIPNRSNIPATRDLGSEPQPKPKRNVKKKGRKEVTSTNVEAKKLEDPQMSEPFESEMYEYLHNMEMEAKRRPLSDYFEKVQKDVTPTMRGILMDWLVKVAEEFKLLSDTLYLSISYIDRFLSVNALNRQKLQLLGVSSMLIASKYEEISPPKVEDFCNITNNPCTKKEVVKMEADILGYLKFEIGSATIKTFLRILIKIAQESYKTSNLKLEFLCYYLSELSFLDYGCVKYLPSLVAASVIFLSRFTIQSKLHPWTSSLQHFSGYKPADLKECILSIHDLQLSKRASSLVAVREKYKQRQFKCVSKLFSPPEIPISYFEVVKES